MIVHISLLWAAGQMLDTGIIEPSKRKFALCAKQWGYLSMRWWGYLTILLMVRGLFTHLKFPCAQFLCTGLAGIINCINYFAVTTLYSITFDRRPTIWSFVGGCVLPWKYGLQGFGCVLWWYWANCRLFSLHESGSRTIYKVINPHALDSEKRYIWPTASHKNYEKLGVKLLCVLSVL